MLVDYHLHLEEGPYNAKWLNRTIQALATMTDEFHLDSKKEQMEKAIQQMQGRMVQGCYSEQWLDLYLKRALQLGIQEVGIVDHLYRFEETRAYFEKYMRLDEQDEVGQLQRKWLDQVMTQNMAQFVTCIEQAKDKWAQQGVTLKLGLECDYFVGGEQELQSLVAGYDWDFLIGSVHFIDGWGFDNPALQHRFRDFEPERLYNHFFETVEQMIGSKQFDFVAHLDNLKVFNYRVQNTAFMHTWYERIAKVLKAANVATEINAGLFYRYPVQESCPAPAFLHALVAHEIPITLSSDAHYPDDLGSFVEDNANQLKQLGVKEVATFSKRVREMKPL